MSQTTTKPRVPLLRDYSEWTKLFWDDLDKEATEKSGAPSKATQRRARQVQPQREDSAIDATA